MARFQKIFFDFLEHRKEGEENRKQSWKEAKPQRDQAFFIPLCQTNFALLGLSTLKKNGKKREKGYARPLIPFPIPPPPQT